jgi:hypothetical protein
MQSLGGKGMNYAHKPLYYVHDFGIHKYHEGQEVFSDAVHFRSLEKARKYAKQQLKSFYEAQMDWIEYLYNDLKKKELASKDTNNPPIATDSVDGGKE